MSSPLPLSSLALSAHSAPSPGHHSPSSLAAKRILDEYSPDRHPSETVQGTSASLRPMTADRLAAQGRQPPVETLLPPAEYGPRVADASTLVARSPVDEQRHLRLVEKRLRVHNLQRSILATVKLTPEHWRRFVDKEVMTQKNQKHDDQNVNGDEPRPKERTNNPVEDSSAIDAWNASHATATPPTQHIASKSPAMRTKTRPESAPLPKAKPTSGHGAEKGDFASEKAKRKAFRMFEEVERQKQINAQKLQEVETLKNREKERGRPKSSCSTTRKNKRRPTTASPPSVDEPASHLRAETGLYRPFDPNAFRADKIRALSPACEARLYPPKALREARELELRGSGKHVNHDISRRTKSIHHNHDPIADPSAADQAESQGPDPALNFSETTLTRLTNGWENRKKANRMALEKKLSKKPKIQREWLSAAEQEEAERSLRFNSEKVQEMHDVACERRKRVLEAATRKIKPVAPLNEGKTLGPSKQKALGQRLCDDSLARQEEHLETTRRQMNADSAKTATRYVKRRKEDALVALFTRLHKE